MLFTLIVGTLVIIIFALTMSNIWDMIRVVLFGSQNDASRDSASAFNPAQDIPSMAGKVVFITGAAGDLGRETAIALARYGRPSRIYIADLPRSDDAKQALVNQIAYEVYGDNIPPTSETGVTTPTEFLFLDLDLASFKSVQKCAQKFATQEVRLDILILNAGIIRVPPATTMEGYEIHFGINYLGHALLTRLLTPVLLRTAQQQPGADVRVVVVSSEGHISAPKKGVDFDIIKTSCSNLVSIFFFWFLSSGVQEETTESNLFLAISKALRPEQSGPHWLNERAQQ